MDQAEDFCPRKVYVGKIRNDLNNWTESLKLFEEIKFLGFFFSVFNLLLEWDCARLEVPLFVDSENALVGGGCERDCAEGSELSSASEIGHWIHLQSQSQMGWQGDLCLLNF